MEDHRLIELASEARSRAYAPYSGYAVGAALLASSGNVYTGCNVENASYGLTICAERNALTKAVCAGEREFEAIAVVTENGGSPCGACRQFLAEFSPDMRVLVADTTGSYRAFALAELLPAYFGPSQLPTSPKACPDQS